jgi:hypothetical protein
MSHISDLASPRRDEVVERTGADDDDVIFVFHLGLLFVMVTFECEIRRDKGYAQMKPNESLPG